MTHYVLTWIDDGVSANAVFVSQDIAKLEEKVENEWKVACAVTWPDQDMDDCFERAVDSGDGSIVFRFDNPVTGNNEIFAQIEKVEMI